MAIGQVDRRAGRPGALGHGLGCGQQGFGPAATADRQAQAAVAAVAAVAGREQVADAGEASEGRVLAARGPAQAPQFGQAAGHQGGLEVVAEAEAVGDPGGDRDDVLERSGQLDPAPVAASVEAQVVAVQEFDQMPDQRFVAGCDQAGGLAADDLLGMARAGQGGQGASAEDILEDFTDGRQRAVFEALGQGHDGGGGVEAVGDVAG